MEFHKNVKTKTKPEILTKKKIIQKACIFPSHSQRSIQTINQSQSQIQNKNLTERILKRNDLEPINQNKNESLIENVKRKINEKIDTNGLINNVPSSSLVINLHPKYQKKQIIKKNFSQIRNPNPTKQIDYQYQIQSLNSSQKSNPNSIKNTSKNNSKEKNSNSSIIIPSLYMHRSSHNINKNSNLNNNEVEIEINHEDDEERTPKIRFHRTKKFSPIFTYNTGENEEIIYNVPFNDEDSIQRNNTNVNMNDNQYYDAYEINEGKDPVQIRILNKKYNKNNKINNNINNNISNNIAGDNLFLYSSDEGMDNSIKFEEDIKNNNIKKKYVRQYTDIYDPKKNQKGILLPKTKLTVPLIESSFNEEKIRYYSGNSKLSNLIMSQKRYSPDPLNLGYDEFFSGSEDKTTCHNEPKIRNLKTFNRRTFEIFAENKKIIKMHKSPEERFKNFSLAMISSKGKNTENRPISRKMRFEKGGVVDFSQEKVKKKKYKYLIKKIRRPIGKQIIHNNPKYREKAAELIQDWWSSIKDFRQKRIKAVILIQSYFRGRFVRKYLYDVIYMNYLYFGFCKKIQKFIKRKYGPYFFNCLFSKFIKQKNALKKIIFKKEKQIIKLYVNKWNKIIKKDYKKKLALLYLLRIRAIREGKMFNLQRALNKWNYIAIIQKERNSFRDLQKSINKENDIKEKNKDKELELNIDKIKSDNILKIKGLMQLINGSDKYIKKISLDITYPKIKIYINEKIKKNKLLKVVKIKEKKELLIIRKYFYIYYEKCFHEEIKNKKIKNRIINLIQNIHNIMI